MAAPDTLIPLQLSKISGRHLLFDHGQIALLRRKHAICGVLVGTVPQNPTQNVFFGVPVEIRQDDAGLLVKGGNATARDEARFQRDLFQDPENAVCKQYVASMKAHRRELEMFLAQEAERKQSLEKELKAAAVGTADQPGSQATAHILSRSVAEGIPCSLSQTTVESRGPSPSSTTSPNHPLPPHCKPLYQHLQSEGYYMTPGLRFGAQLSVYPGDPFRFHSHHIANCYDWNEGIPLLDIVTGGRLSTAVKKAFLIGGEDQNSLTDFKHEHLENSKKKSAVRIFCIEWAAM